jgi:SpoVK/Ycf46/Vps4 family AAA+-type ATPase
MRTGGPERAKGILLIGPPGTGKTMLARAIGKLVKLPVVEFRISSLMNSLLDETERRFAQAFQTLAAMSPNVVFIDEIEKAFGDSSERDGGTMMRYTGALLSWLSDNPHPNYIVATSDSLRRMGEIGLTMTRSERFDAAFFVDVPGILARQRMLETWLKGRIKNPGAAEELASLIEKFSGADIR